MLPLVGRLRLMMFVSLLSLFVTCVFLFLDISHIVYLFPFNWAKVVSCASIRTMISYWFNCFPLFQNAYFYVSLSVLFLIASTLIFHSVFLSDAFSWVPKWTNHQLLVTGVSIRVARRFYCDCKRWIDDFCVCRRSAVFRIRLLPGIGYNIVRATMEIGPLPASRRRSKYEFTGATDVAAARFARASEIESNNAQLQAYCS